MSQSVIPFADTNASLRREVATLRARLAAYEGGMFDGNVEEGIALGLMAADRGDVDVDAAWAELDELSRRRYLARAAVIAPVMLAWIRGE